MAFTVPADVTSFFSRYPNAEPVFVSEGGKKFLSIFQENAIRHAMINEDRLYQVSANGSYQQVYPATASYSGVVQRPVVQASCNIQSASISDDTDLDLQQAITQAATAANVNLVSVNIQDQTTKWQIEITSEVANWSFKQSDGQIVNLVTS